MPVNLVPVTATPHGSYLCTWNLQCSTAAEGRRAEAAVVAGDQGSLSGPDNLDEGGLFGDAGWLRRGYEAIRGDLAVVLDHGWDLPVGHDAGRERWRFGAMEPDPGRFPSLGGTPAERTRQLAQRVADLGWAGLGLWVAPQLVGDGREAGALRPDAEVEPYWRERMRWSLAAGVRYWKVDWGWRDQDERFRALLTRLAREGGSGLLVEHAPICGPLNDEPCPWHRFRASRSGRFASWDDGGICASARRLLLAGDVYRTYDVTAPLAIATTLDRVAALLADGSPEPGSRALVNAEDELYLGAALGCTLGIMRHPRMATHGRTAAARHDGQRAAEAVRAVRWQRLAPPLGAGAASTILDGDCLADEHLFRPEDTWAHWHHGTVVRQLAPARIARGLELPTVSCAGDPPFVVASRHPGGAVGVAALPRRLAVRGLIAPPAEIGLRLPAGSRRIASFGSCAALRLRSPDRPTRVLAQDLASDEALDITAQVRRDDDALVIPGELIERLGTRANPPGDSSAPGLLLALES